VSALANSKLWLRRWGAHTSHVVRPVRPVRNLAGLPHTAREEAGMVRRVGIGAGLTGVLIGLVACGGAQVPASQVDPAVAAKQHAVDAEHVLDQARLQAIAKHSAVIAVLQADWCQPCNELQFRVLETHEGKAIVDKHVMLQLDFDDPLGGAVASKLHVLGLPTTVVLRPDGGQLREFARIEGFDQPDAYRIALNQALARANPAPIGCVNAEGRLLNVSRPAPLLLADLDCVSMQLATDQGAAASAQLHALLDDPVQRAAMTQWPEDAREKLLAVVQALGRFDSRVAQKPLVAAALFGVFADWQGTPAPAVSSLVFWHARCLAKAGDMAGAERVLDAYIAKEQGSASARLLAADLMVHEHVAPERAKRLLADLLNADPGDHWAHYLAGELAAQMGDRDGARKHLATANHLKPGVALYMRHFLRLGGDTLRVE
jgi:thioredoxin-like negative regulator of GroEL